MIFNMVGGGGSRRGMPEFTYTGTYNAIEEGNGNWNIRFLTSGTLSFKKLKGAAKGIEIFAVGGGAAGRATYTSGSNQFGGWGGAGGKTACSKTNNPEGIFPTENVDYSITIGSGGANSNGAGKATVVNIVRVLTAEGGSDQSNGTGAGGNGAGRTYSASTYRNSQPGGAGVLAFGDSSFDSILYGPGGGGGCSSADGGTAAGSIGGKTGGGSGSMTAGVAGGSAAANSGGGGGGGGFTASKTTAGGAGGSGIVIIRNVR